MQKPLLDSSGVAVCNGICTAQVLFFAVFVLFLDAGIFCGAVRRAGLGAFAAGLYWVFYNTLIFQREVIAMQPERKYLPDYIARNISPCDYVFNGDGMMYNLFGKDPAYYWQLIGQLDVVGDATGIKPKPDINALILKLRPKFVYGKSYFNKFSDESGRPEVVHYVDRDIINAYYNATRFGSVYQLKPEFDKRKCIKDGVDGKWHFADE